MESAGSCGHSTSRRGSRAAHGVKGGRRHRRWSSPWSSYWAAGGAKSFLVSSSQLKVVNGSEMVTIFQQAGLCFTHACSLRPLNLCVNYLNWQSKELDSNSQAFSRHTLVEQTTLSILDLKSHRKWIWQKSTSNASNHSYTYMHQWTWHLLYKSHQPT